MLSSTTTTNNNNNQDDQNDDNQSTSSSSSSSSSNSSSNNSSSSENSITLPFSSSFPIHVGTKAVSSVGLDKNGGRLVTGTIDGGVHIYDLKSSNPTKPIRILATEETQGVVTSIFDSTGHFIAIARRDPKIKIYDRDGTNGKGHINQSLATTTRGDMYLIDTTKTKGHTLSVTSARWSLTKPNILISSSADGTCRVWDIDGGPKALMGLELACTYVLKARNSTLGGNQRVGVLSCNVSNKDTIVAACTDGSIQIWDSKPGYQPKPDIATRSGSSFTPTETDAMDIVFSPDERYIVLAASHLSTGITSSSSSQQQNHQQNQRGMIVIWDIRKLSSDSPPPVLTYNLPGVRGLQFMNDHNIFLATSKRGLGAYTMEDEVKEINGFNGFGNNNNTTTTTITSLPCWNEISNQVAVGCSDGTSHIVYDEEESQGGVLVGKSKQQHLNTTSSSSSTYSSSHGATSTKRNMDEMYVSSSVLLQQQELDQDIVLSGEDAFRMNNNKRPAATTTTTIMPGGKGQNKNNYNTQEDGPGKRQRDLYG
jgi:WD40 repeat protein